MGKKIKRDDTNTLYQALVSGSYDNTQFKQMTVAEQNEILDALVFAGTHCGN
jgi:hypothetical protein